MSGRISSFVCNVRLCDTVRVSCSDGELEICTHRWSLVSKYWLRNSSDLDFATRDELDLFLNVSNVCNNEHLIESSTSASQLRSLIRIACELQVDPLIRRILHTDLNKTFGRFNLVERIALFSQAYAYHHSVPQLSKAFELFCLSCGDIQDDDKFPVFPFEDNSLPHLRRVRDEFFQGLGFFRTVAYKTKPDLILPPLGAVPPLYTHDLRCEMSSCEIELRFSGSHVRLLICRHALASVSAYFNGKLTGDMEHFDIEEITAEEIEIFLKGAILEEKIRFDPDQISILLKLAHKFGASVLMIRLIMLFTSGSLQSLSQSGKLALLRVVSGAEFRQKYPILLESIVPLCNDVPLHLLYDLKAQTDNSSMMRIYENKMRQDEKKYTELNDEFSSVSSELKKTEGSYEKLQKKYKELKVEKKKLERQLAKAERK